MKHTIFLWGWKHYPKKPDTSMTRARMAVLMRAWRRSRTQENKNFVLILLSRENGKREYSITTSGYKNDDHALFTVCTHEKI